MAVAGDPFIGMRLADRYELEERIGAGGMGVVYRARQLGLDREVAVKLLSAAGGADQAWTARFRTEAQALARLQHPNTVRVYEFGAFNNVPFLVMELLRGRTLEQLLENEGALPVPRALRIIIQLCSSLEEAHRAGIIHGDLKPPNVFLLDVEGATDFVKLVDFSVARLAWGEITDDRSMGTSAYMSPEWTAGGSVGPAADVYGCGVTAFRMLTGHLPSPSRARTLYALLAKAPDDAAAIVLRAMERAPEARYAAVADLRRACEQRLGVASALLPTTVSNAGLRSATPGYSWSDPPPGLRPRLTMTMSDMSDIGDLAWSPDGRWLVVGQHEILHFLDIKFNRRSTVMTSAMKAMAWLGEDRILLTGKKGADVARVAADAVGAVSITMEQSVSKAPVDRVACSPDGLTFAIAAQRTLSIMNRQTCELVLKIDLAHTITGLAWNRHGTLAVGMDGDRVVVFDGDVGEDIQITHRVFSGDTGESSQATRRGSSANPLSRNGALVGWAHDGSVLAISSTAHGTALWSMRGEVQFATLETPSSAGVSFSATGSLFANLGTDGMLTVWRYDRVGLVATLDPAPDAHSIWAETREVGKNESKIAFHPKLPVLAAIGYDGVHLWDVDIALLHASSDQTVHYANAKVVVVGDSGVGKSALGLVLTGDAFRPTESTHGRHIWTLATETAPADDSAMVYRETLLWDLAGQPGYRVFHRQHLDEVSVALVLFDARSETDAFAGVAYWARALDDARRGFPVTKFLVASRIDRGGTIASELRVSEMTARYGFSRYFETSAKSGDGVVDLSAAIRAAIAWDRLPRVSASKLFYDMKSFVLAEKLGGRVVQRRGELRERVCRLTSTEVSPESFDICVGRLEASGLVKRLSFGDLVLLQPEMLDDYSAWMAQAARKEPEGLGFLSERTARAGGFSMDGDRPLRGRAEEALLLTATVEDVVGRGIALRQPTEQGEMLVFPSELRDDMPEDVPEYVRTVIFHFDGPVKSVYATLAVCLAHAPAFTRQRFYRDAAVFRSASGETCGFRMDYPRPSDDAHGRLTVFFDAGANLTTKLTFLRYVNRQLEIMAFGGSLQRERVYQCDCGYPEPISRAAVEWRIKHGEQNVICSACGRHVRLDTLAEQSTQLDSVVEQQIEGSDAERERQRRLSVMSERERGAEYHVFLCHDSRDKPQVIRLATRLRDQGILPWLDSDALLAGTPIVPALEAILDRVSCAAVIVGPHALGPWHEHEYYALIQRHIERRSDIRRRLRVIPILLPGAVDPPPFLRSLVSVDFRSASRLDDREEFKKLVQAILIVRTPERTDAV